MQSFPGRTKFIPSKKNHVPRRRKNLPLQTKHKLTARERRELEEMTLARRELAHTFASGTSKL